ncbi:hypothetical protein [Salibacterium aidingense]|uniref:hypothetical protein n=1 Tax=Salibacterium aidingense TaxID=384933 RepID=UPI00040704E8|nr:hypothetical protein [Salibacterium aidingense]
MYKTWTYKGKLPSEEFTAKDSFATLEGSVFGACMMQAETNRLFRRLLSPASGKREIHGRLKPGAGRDAAASAAPLFEETILSENGSELGGLWYGR